jgi:hypothetical protein
MDWSYTQEIGASDSETWSTNRQCRVCGDPCGDDDYCSLDCSRYICDEEDSTF